MGWTDVVCGMIGTRKPEETDPAYFYLYRSFARILGEQNAILVTGAAPGCDQVAATAALQAGGRVRLKLPCPSFQTEWVRRTVLEYPEKVNVEIYSQETHPDWRDSVHHYHPAPGQLTHYAFGLHARNYGIVYGAQAIVALPRSDEAGGTAQGIRIAEGHQIPLYVLTRLPDRRRLLAVIDRLELAA